MDYESISNILPINDVDPDLVKKIAESMSNGWSGPALLYSSAHNMAITGSHRIAAAKLLIDTDESYGEYDGVVIDVDEYLEDYCEREDITIDQIPFDNLRLIFEGTDIESEAQQNIEY